MEKEEFRHRIYDCLDVSIKEIRWQIDNAIENGIADVCDEKEAGYYGDVKAILYEVLEKSIVTVGTPCMPSCVKRFNKVRKAFKWQIFH